ncbi:MAG: SurA N-terminal domain-containing protein [Candidatus Wildermuthbacteria bacterium]|nr:SurA N-terminal domain-containing protein [Candidatus Wildermuthbacteria bacterium]
MKTDILKKPILLAILALLLLGGVGYAAFAFDIIDLSRFSLVNRFSSQEFMAQVNGEGVQTALFDLRFAQIEDSYKAQGTILEGENRETVKQQILQDMINEILLVQYGKEQGIVAGEEAIDNEYQRIVSQFPGEEKEFRQNLAAKDITLEDIRRTISQDLIIQQVIEQQTAQNNIEVSEQEIQQTYDEAKAQSAEVPPFEEAKPQIENFLRQQKIGQIINTLVAQLREKANIVISS